MAVLLHFLFDFGLPWLEFRQAIRSNDFEKMNSMYALTLAWFMVTGKVMYARICLDFIYIIQAMNASLRSIFNANRTVSLLGHEGRNIPFDQANAFQNRFTVEFNPKSPSRIDKVLTMLNGLRETDDQLRSLLGVDRADPAEYTAVKANHIDALLAVLREKLGADTEAVLGDRRKKSSPFGSGVKWKQVARQTAVERGEYVDTHLETAPPR